MTTPSSSVAQKINTFTSGALTTIWANSHLYDETAMTSGKELKVAPVLPTKYIYYLCISLLNSVFFWGGFLSRSTQRSGHLRRVCPPSRSYCPSRNTRRETRSGPQEPGLHRLRDDTIRSVSSCIWFSQREELHFSAAHCCFLFPGALKTDHTEVLLSADFTGAIKVFINVKKYWAFRKQVCSAEISPKDGRRQRETVQSGQGGGSLSYFFFFYILFFVPGNCERFSI